MLLEGKSKAWERCGSRGGDLHMGNVQLAPVEAALKRGGVLVLFLRDASSKCDVNVIALEEVHGKHRLGQTCQWK